MWDLQFHSSFVRSLQLFGVSLKFHMNSIKSHRPFNRDYVIYAESWGVFQCINVDVFPFICFLFTFSNIWLFSVYISFTSLVKFKYYIISDAVVNVITHVGREGRGSLCWDYKDACVNRSGVTLGWSRIREEVQPSPNTLSPEQRQFSFWRGQGHPLVTFTELTVDC